MKKIVIVVYTPILLSRDIINKKIINRDLKVYHFTSTNDLIKLGDLIESPDYTTPMQIFDIIISDSTTYKGFYLKNLNISKINGVDLNELENRSKEIINNKKNKMANKKIFNSFIEKYKSQFIPNKEDDLKLSIDGNICVKINNEYIGIDKDNNLISYPEEMCLNVPIYILSKTYDKIKIGDIIKTNNNYAKVLKKNANNSLSCLSFTGNTQNKKEIKDFILNESFVEVVINLFDTQSNNINPMLFAMCNDNDTDFKDIMLLQMLQQNDKNKQINPMMMMYLLNKNEDTNSTFEQLMMMQMMNGQLNLPFMQNTTNDK